MRHVSPSRLQHLERQLHPQPDKTGRLVLCCVEHWPADAQVAWHSACAAGDVRQREDLVERYEGTRPRLGGLPVSLILVPPPPDERPHALIHSDEA